MPPLRSKYAPSPLADWLSARLRWITLPSWLLSGLFHVGLAFLIISTSQWASCRGDIGGDDGESFRAVGLRTRPAPVETAVEQNSSEPTAAESPDESTPSESVQKIVADEPPVPLQLPATAPASPPLMGAGLPPSVASSNSLRDLIRPRAGQPASAAGGATGGGTSFLGINDSGRRFVYVIDRSYSMYDHGALQAAKQELLASVQRLDETQQFQIIFYNDKYSVLQSHDQRFEMFWGRESDRLQVREQVAGVSPSGGTHHAPALLRAFQFNPDVVFLLTDATADSALTAREMDDVRRHNRGRARIHCIEFGQGPQKTLAGNFLKALAEETGGKYVYRDVTSLE